MLENEIIALLQNRKKSLNERKGSAVQRGDTEQLADIETKLEEVEALLYKLQGS
jgi:hypothetical protein